MSWNDIFRRVIRNLSSQEEKQARQTKSNVEKKSSHSLGIETQFPGKTSNDSRKQLIIGLDFGTAFTKVIIGEERIKYAIPFRGSGTSISNYLLPSAFWIQDGGACSITSPAGEQVGDLKIALITGDLSQSSLFKVITYLALVLRKVRAYIFNSKQNIYGGFYIDWLVNIGLPTDSYHDDTLNETYKKLLSIAWILSAEPGDVSLEKVAKYHADYDHLNVSIGNALHQEAISVFPEFVAQVTGYVRSPMRKRGLHYLIDVGAGTLDATLFNVHEQEGEDTFPIFAKAVAAYGTRFLVKHRIKNTNLNESGDLAPYAPIPTIRRFASLLQKTKGEIIKSDVGFKDKIISLLRELLRHTKQNKYPSSDYWQSGVPLFLCGGGANCDFYKNTILDNGQIAEFKIHPMELPKPDMLEAVGVSTDDYNRLSVAFGLSFDPFDIGEIIKEDDVGDFKDEETVGLNFCPVCHGSGGLHHPCRRCGGSGFID